MATLKQPYKQARSNFLMSNAPPSTHSSCCCCHVSNFHEIPRFQHFIQDNNPTARRKRRLLLLLSIAETLRRKHTACCGPTPLLSPCCRVDHGASWPVLQPDLEGVFAKKQSHGMRVPFCALRRVSICGPTPWECWPIRTMCNEHGCFEEACFIAGEMLV